MFIKFVRNKTARKFGRRWFSSSVSNPYEILGVTADAEFNEIKKAYFKLVTKFHPDKNPSEV